MEQKLYHGDPNADRIIVLMGSSAETMRETVDHLTAAGERVVLISLRCRRDADGAGGTWPIVPRSRDGEPAVRSPGLSERELRRRRIAHAADHCSGYHEVGPFLHIAERALPQAIVAALSNKVIFILDLC